MSLSAPPAPERATVVIARSSSYPRSCVHPPPSNCATSGSMAPSCCAPGTTPGTSAMVVEVSDCVLRAGWRVDDGVLSPSSQSSLVLGRHHRRFSARAGKKDAGAASQRRAAASLDSLLVSIREEGLHETQTRRASPKILRTQPLYKLACRGTSTNYNSEEIT